jgi:predicted nucleic acid-binding protein
VSDRVFLDTNILVYARASKGGGAG